MDKKRNMQDEVSDKLMKANKEKEELLALVMQRGKLIQVLT